MGPEDRIALPVGMRFRPSSIEMASFLIKKALGQHIKARTVPEECHDIFSRHPRDLPGYPGERHWYLYCKNFDNQVLSRSHNLWIPTGKEKDVIDIDNNGDLVAIKRSFAFIENEDYDDKETFSEDEEPPHQLYNWFLNEIRLPLIVLDTDWVLCHVFAKKIEPKVVKLALTESQGVRRRRKRGKNVDKDAETLDLVGKKDETVHPPPPA